MEPIIGIPLGILARFMASHARFSHDEYNRNAGYNDTHHSHIAAEALLKSLQQSMGQEHFRELVIRAGTLSDALVQPDPHGAEPFRAALREAYGHVSVCGVGMDAAEVLEAHRPAVFKRSMQAYTEHGYI